MLAWVFVWLWIALGLLLLAVAQLAELHRKSDAIARDVRRIRDRTETMNSR